MLSVSCVTVGFVFLAAAGLCFYRFSENIREPEGWLAPVEGPDGLVEHAVFDNRHEAEAATQKFYDDLLARTVALRARLKSMERNRQSRSRNPFSNFKAVSFAGHVSSLPRSKRNKPTRNFQ